MWAVPDVTEVNTPSGPVLAVDDKHQYADLDEPIVNHVQAIAHKVEELMTHEKFKHERRTPYVCSYSLIRVQLTYSTQDLSLKNFVAANPAKSAYRFTLNRRRPGDFNLCFLANKNLY